MTRALLLSALCVFGCAKSTRQCKSGTAFLTIHFDAASAQADQLQVILSLDGMTQMSSVHRGPGATSTVEVDFDKGYPAGKSLDITVVASSGSMEIGRGHLVMPLSPGCSALSLDVMGESFDLRATDGGEDLAEDLAESGDQSTGNDMPNVDLPPPPPDLALPPCSIIYVSPTGDDSHNGCSPAAPVATIPHALTLTASTSKEVHVCAGTYSGFTISQGVVRGNYDCTTWMRLPAFGYPTFDKSNASVINNTDYANTSVTVVVSGAATVDGLLINGATAGSNGSVGLAVTGSGAGAVNLTNNQVLGGGASASGQASQGLYVGNGVNADIGMNSFNGGTGSTSSASYGSIGVNLDPGGGTVRLHDNLIDGGSGSDLVDSFGSHASVGLLVQSGTYALGTNAILSNTINGGNGTASTTGGDGFGGVGVMIVQSATVDLITNAIDGGIGQGGKEGTVGIFNASTGQVNIRRNRIFGGKVGSPVPSFWSSWGIQTLQNSNAEITNNMIHGGDDNGSGNFAVGVISYSAGNVVLHHNTIIGGSSTGFSTAIYVLASTQNLVVANNLLAGDGGTSAGLYFGGGCQSNGTIKAFNNNAILYNLPMYYAGVSLPCTSKSFTSASAMEAELLNRCKAGTPGACNTFGGTNASNNQLVIDSAATCGDTQCAPVSGCTSANGCFAGVFGAWDATSNGKANLFGSGWQLITNDPCALTQGGKDLTATVGLDLYGTTRTVPVSIGAHEFDGTCIP
jgi:hypothetical protein